jgi:6-phosphogluconolactonase
MRLDGLRGEQHVEATAEESAAWLAEVLAQHLRQRLAAVAQVHLALSGGSSGKMFCAALARTRGLDWAHTHVWMVDERCVPDDDPRLNFGAIRDELAAQVPLPVQNLHPMPVARLDGALVYERELRAALAERQANDQRLDAVVLGMGADGHTASLFPGTAALDERERWIVLNDGATVAPPRPRMTVTFPLLNRARFVALLVTGASKQAALARVAQATEDYHALPVAGLAPTADARLLWCLDQAALPF